MIQKSKEKIYELLRWSEKYTGTDMVYLASGSFWLGASRIFSALASFATSIVFANFLTPEVYGQYRYVLALFGFLTISSLNGMDTAVTQAVARGEDGSVRPAFKSKILWGILGGIAGLGVASYYWLQQNYTLAWVSLITAVFIPLMDPLYLFVAVQNGKKHFSTSVKYNVVIRIVASIALITVAIFYPRVIPIVLVYFAANTLLRYVFFKKTLKTVDQNAPSDQETISFGKHLTSMSLISQISNYLDKALIFHFAGGAALAAYYLSMTPYKQMQTILGSINVLAIPKFSISDPKTLKKTLPPKMLKSYLIIIPIIVVYILAAPFFFRVFYPQYLSSVLLSQIFVLLLLSFPINFMSSALTSQQETKKLYFSSTAYSFLRIVLLLALVPFFGIYGAAAAILTTILISSFITAILFYRM